METYDDDILRFAATLDRIAIDREGVTKITLLVPQLFKPVVQKLITHTETTLNCKIKPGESLHASANPQGHHQENQGE